MEKQREDAVEGGFLPALKKVFSCELWRRLFVQSEGGDDESSGEGNSRYQIITRLCSTNQNAVLL